MIKDSSVNALNSYKVEVKNLSKSFGTNIVLENITFEIPNGKSMVLLGPSGCGKTTILRCLAGLETADSGSIHIANQIVFDRNLNISLPPEKRQLGIVFQSYAIWPHMSVGANVSFPLVVRGVTKNDIQSRLHKILEMVGLGGWADRSATELSGGQQQRVALARALIHEPRVVLFDEALSNLDAQLREQMRIELKQLQARLGFTAIYVTHDQSEALGLADHIVMINQGKIEVSGAPDEIFNRPKTPFSARFFGFNVLDGIADYISPLIVNSASNIGDGIKYVRVIFPGGSFLWGRLQADLQIYIGMKVSACIRREHIEFFNPGVRALDYQAVAIGDIPDFNQSIQVPLVASSFQGLTEEYVFKFGGQELRAVHLVRNINVGELISLNISPNHCVILRSRHQNLES